MKTTNIRMQLASVVVMVLAFSALVLHAGQAPFGSVVLSDFDSDNALGSSLYPAGHWRGTKRDQGSTSTCETDSTMGALGSRKSMKWSYETQGGWADARIRPSGPGQGSVDFSMYDSVAFYVKAQKPGRCGFLVRGGPHSGNDHTFVDSRFEFTTEWRQIVIDLTTSEWTKLDMKDIFLLSFFVWPRSSGSNVIWIDEITCHKKGAVKPVAQQSRAPSVIVPVQTALTASATDLPTQEVLNDTGINVLLDLSHQMLFYLAWDLPPALREHGFRIVGSQASLHTVLLPRGYSRVRVPIGDEHPFRWILNPDFNVIFTFQSDPNAQPYLPNEIAALHAFTRQGGGLVMVGGKHLRNLNNTAWPLNTLAKTFGAEIAEELTVVAERQVSSLRLSRDWVVDRTDTPQSETKQRDNQRVRGKPVVAHRTFGDGCVVIVSDYELIKWDEKVSADNPWSRAKVSEFLAGVLRTAAGGAKKPVGGTLRLPTEAAGGAAIYPELSYQSGEMLYMYAANQKQNLLRDVFRELPRVEQQVLKWFPSPKGGKTMNIILSAGDGGGWAVNVYKPEEVGIVCLNKNGILSIFAHELTHNLPGPANGRGSQAGRLPEVFQEAHAGWYQGKLNVLLDGKREYHDPNNIFDFDKKLSSLDLALVRGHVENGWKKLWYIWQKLDDRFGPTWYPRWIWVKNVRWQDSPNRELSWDDIVEDMSIAVGEDLFPFFRRLGTTLMKERFSSATFDGKNINLPIAPIQAGRAGKAKTGPIGDFKLPLTAPIQR